LLRRKYTKIIVLIPVLEREFSFGFVNPKNKASDKLMIVSR